MVCCYRDGNLTPHQFYILLLRQLLPSVSSPALLHYLANSAIVFPLVLTEHASCLGICRGVWIWVAEERLQEKKCLGQLLYLNHYEIIRNQQPCHKMGGRLKWIAAETSHFTHTHNVCERDGANNVSKGAIFRKRTSYKNSTALNKMQIYDSHIKCSHW